MLDEIHLPKYADRMDNSYKELRACPLCERDLAGVGFDPLPRFRRDFIVRCRACGFHFSLRIPSPADYQRVYSNYDYVGEDGARSEISIGNERQIAEGLSTYRSTGNILDIAAGAGRFLTHFRDLGFTCYATEFDGLMQQYLGEKGFSILPGNLYPAAPQPGMFDAVLFTEIIEHVNEPMPILRHIHGLVRPGGCLYVTTPNFASLERRLLGQDWGMICWPEHITYWTPAHLHRALTAAGFRRRWLTAENISPFRVIQALKKGSLGSKLGDVSEQEFSARAQQRVASSKFLQIAKRMVNLGLNRTGLGSSIKAIYENPVRP
jgi:2-polyprenyl-3-methyl-5-hydroxy-6-metoxy-1,4-benzoquinol methylase